MNATKLIHNYNEDMTNNRKNVKLTNFHSNK